MPPRPLIRQEVVNARADLAFATPIIVRPVALKVLLLGFLAFVAACTIVAAKVELPRVLTSTGVVWPLDGLTVLRSPVDGIVSRVQLAENATVIAGDPILWLEALDMSSSVKEEKTIVASNLSSTMRAQQALRQARDTAFNAGINALSQQASEIEQQLTHAVEKSRAAQRRMDLAKENLTRQSDLAERGYISSAAQVTLSENLARRHP